MNAFRSFFWAVVRVVTPLLGLGLMFYVALHKPVYIRNLLRFNAQLVDWAYALIPDPQGAAIELATRDFLNPVKGILWLEAFFGVFLVYLLIRFIFWSLRALWRALRG